MRADLKCFLFDFDETIVYSHMDHVKAFMEVGRRHGLRLTKRQILERFGKSAISILAELFPELPDEKIMEIRNEKERLYRKIISNKDIRTIDGAEDLFAFLRKNGVRMGIVSSASVRNIRIGLRENGLTKYFDAIVGVENCKRHKPNPDPVLKCMKMLRARPKDCAMVGDSIYDMMSAKRARVLPLGMKTGFYSEMQLKFNGARRCFGNHTEILSRLSPSRNSVSIDI